MNTTADIDASFTNSAITDNFDLALQIINIFFGVMGLLGNVFVVIVIVGFTKMHKQITNMYVVNQSIIDAISSLFLIAQMLSQNMKITLMAQQPLSEIFCRFWGSQVFLWSFYISSTYNIVVLTIERYLKIVHPVLHKVSFTRYKAKALLAFVWLFGISFELAYVVPTSAVIKDICWPLAKWPNDVIRTMVSYIILTIEYWLPILVFIIAYWKMILALKRQISDRSTRNEGEFYYVSIVVRQSYYVF